MGIIRGGGRGRGERKWIDKTQGKDASLSSTYIFCQKWNFWSCIEFDGHRHSIGPKNCLGFFFPIAVTTMRLPRRVPWASLAELEQVCSSIYTDENDIDAKNFAINRASRTIATRSASHVSIDICVESYHHPSPCNRIYFSATSCDCSG